jgi:hypothetical protein
MRIKAMGGATSSIPTFLELERSAAISNRRFLQRELIKPIDGVNAKMGQ